MTKKIINEMEAVARKKGYEDIVLNCSKKKPLIIEGIKGSFVPEILCYSKEQLRALMTFIESLEEIREFHKLTLFIDFAHKNKLFLYIAYNEQSFSKDQIVQKLAEKGVEIPENINIVGVNS